MPGAFKRGQLTRVQFCFFHLSEYFSANYLPTLLDVAVRARSYLLSTVRSLDAFVEVSPESDLTPPPSHNNHHASTVEKTADRK